MHMLELLYLEIVVHYFDPKSNEVEHRERQSC